MHRYYDFMLEGPLATVDEMTHRTRARLVAYRESGGTDEEFAEALIKEFVEQAQQHPAGAGAIHMAISLYRLVQQQEKVWELQDTIAMRDDILKTLWDIEDLP
jgi:hypothetical protein